MATLEENINQAISDFNDIELALEEQGVNVPSGTDTSEYGNLVRSISNNGTVDQTYNPTSVNAQSGIAVAEAMSELPITLVESPDTNGNILDIYSMDSGTYIFSGKFTPYPEASTTFSFSSGQLVTIRHGSISTVAQVFYPPNNAIQYLDIRPDETSETGYTYTRQDAKLVNMESITNRVTTLDEDCDDEHYPTAKAVYDQLNELNKIATTDIDGLLSASDKSKLDGIEEGANKTIVDSELSNTSTNPLQNKVVTERINSANSTIASINSALDTKVTREVAVVGSDEANSAGWYKVADGTMPKTSNLSMMFLVHSTFLNKQYSGILQLDLYCASYGNTYCHQLGWLVRNGFDTNQVIVTIDGSNWAMYFNVSTSQYYRTFFEVMQKSSTKSSLLSNYNLYTDSVVETTEPTATYTSADLGVIKTINENLDKKVNLTNGTIQGAVDWNTITKTGCYKIQGCTMTADYNAPQAYQFGVLQVLNSENETGGYTEHRVMQIYFARAPQPYSMYMRSNNSTTGYNNWTDWVGFYDAKQVDPKLETKASVETGICTLTVSNGSVSNASYSKTGKDVTVNFWFYPADTNEVVVSGLPYVATKNQSGIASASVGGVRVSYEMSKDNANATLYPETTSEQYCTLTYNLGAYNPQP